MAHPRESPHSVYTARLADRQRALATLDSRRRLLGWARLLAAAAIVASVWFAIQTILPLPAVLASVAVFIALVSRHARADRAASRMRRAILFYERGLARLEHRWQGLGDTGERFSDPQHPYAADLDLFGRASLFQLLSTARTRAGEARLAHWLKSAAPVPELRSRHHSIDELRPLIDLREQLAILGEDFRGGVNPEHLTQWATEPARPFSTWQRTTAATLSAIAAVVLVWWFSTAFMGFESRMALLAVAAAEGLFAITLRDRILQILHGLSEPSNDLDLLAGILTVLETESFHSPRLAELLRSIRPDQGAPASKRIARLRRLRELLDSRDNVFVRMFGPLLLWGTQTAMAIEHWRTENGPYVARWLDAVAEIEALSSLAGYAFEHPDDPFPEFRETPGIEGDNLRHPLMDPARAVANSIALTVPPALYVVSGSNMSGKSTFLRTVGVNAVLALAGAPVRASRLAVSQLSVGASIRTVDSLEGGISRFMAELLRLRQILELPAPALFLLDELLAGTNSHDRAIGAAGLVRALLAKGAVGITTTHDLSLAKVADELAPNAINVHFEDRLESGKLIFDYQMREGVVKRSNALDLMRTVGLEV